MAKSFYLKLNTKPDLKSHIVAVYRIESKLKLTESAVKIAEESSIGTWTDLDALDKKMQNELGPQIFYLNEKTKIVKIAYPLDLFEFGNVTQLLSGLAGNIFSMKIIRNLRLLDLNFPKKYLDSFKGPKFGINGVREIFKIKNRPIVGSIIKPKMGLSAKQHAKLAYDVWMNGVDIVKDDENLTDMKFNRFEDRVREVIKLRKIVEKKTKSIKMHVFNVTGSAEIMLERANFVKKMGGRVVMIDLVACGIDNIQFLRNQNLGLILHGHRAGHSMFTKNTKHGMTMLVLAKLARLVGIDQLHTGTVVGKMDGNRNVVTKINNSIQEDWFSLNNEKDDWSNIKPVFPIASGGLHPGLVPKLIKILGKNIIINFGGGIHGHPEGSIAGARACKQAVDGSTKNINFKRFIKNNLELKQAINFWKK